MNTADPTLAARFFFRNCAVSLHLPGEMRISRTLTPLPGDIVLDRDFIPAGSPSEFIGGQSDFYRFLDVTSTSNASLIKKLASIGYLLCNKLPKHNPTRLRSFICVNEDKGAIGNGKSLFCDAIGQYCNTLILDSCCPSDRFWLSNVTNQTNLIIVESINRRTNLELLFTLCTNDWIINRKRLEPKIIPFASTPHILLTSNMSIANVPRDGGFRRRFCVLYFSSFFSQTNTVRDFLGHDMFSDWDNSQWHMFDNFMFYCVLEYLRSYSRGEDIFSLYR
ncbi:MAG: hypothetical protein K2M49_02720 [Muribaculaceae bacterium]|nr:hypothetical protein [Muribaculaceae bacterium]